jgi:hypothetical protein
MKLSFCEDKYQEAIDSVVGYIETMNGLVINGKDI